MGVAVSGGGGQRGKSLDAELNLVPFIDLLVCCICFLLITAVWTQLAQIPAATRSPAGPGGTPASTMLAKVSVLIGDEGYTLLVGQERLALPKHGAAYDTAALGRQLADLRAKLPQQQAITVAAEDAVAYRHLIQAMDLARQQNFSAIRVCDAAAWL